MCTGFSWSLMSGCARAVIGTRSITLSIPPDILTGTLSLKAEYESREDDCGVMKERKNVREVLSSTSRSGNSTRGIYLNVGRNQMGNARSWHCRKEQTLLEILWTREARIWKQGLERFAYNAE
ncbi:hypothetical protein Tco_0409951 [Tanacetum coccineum]